MMSFDAFVDYVIARLQKKVGVECEVIVRDVLKNNGVMVKGISVIGKSTLCTPIVYLEAAYNKYMQGYDPENIVEDILYQCENSGDKMNDFSSLCFDDWEKVKPYIRGKMINYESNKAFLKDKPYIRFLDMAVMFQYTIALGFDTNGSITINDDIMNRLEIDVGELEEAMKTNEKASDYTITPIEEVLGEMLCSVFETDCDNMSENMYVVTNLRQMNGGTAFLYKDIFKKLAEQELCDVVILPSSVHELIIIPLNQGCEKIDVLNQMVREVNASVVDPTEILSDHVYIYSRSRDEVVAA